MKDKKTTIAGIGAILVAVGSALVAYFDGDVATNIDLAATVAAIIAGVGLIMAKDSQPTQP
jgi:uncharacterized membrane protein YhiD involved in acid resistance